MVGAWMKHIKVGNEYVKIIQEEDDKFETRIVSRCKGKIFFLFFYL